MYKRLGIKSIYQMKYLLILFALLLVAGCETCPTVPQHPFTIHIHSGEGWTERHGYFSCDSFQMHSVYQADVWVNGTKMQVKSEKPLGITN